MKGFVVWPGLIVELTGILVLAAGIVTGMSPAVWLGILLLCTAMAIHAAVLIRWSRDGPRKADGASSPAPAGTPLQPGILYADHLVTLDSAGITFHHYSGLPFFASDRTLPYQDIDRIEIRRPTILNGRWRIGGSSDLRTWFPTDWDRPSRDRIFRAFVRTRGMNIGFTVGDPVAVTAILRQQGVPVTDEVGVRSP